MQPTSQNQGNKNIRFMSLGKQKNWDIFSSSLKAALLLFMFVYLFACSLKLSSFVCFSLFLSICFPVCQSLCLSLFPCLSFLDISILVCQVNLNLSTCSLRNASSQGCFFFSKRNLESIPDVSAWIQAGKVSVYRTQSNRISGHSLRRVSARKKAGSWVSLPWKSSVSKYTWW